MKRKYTGANIAYPESRSSPVHSLLLIIAFRTVEKISDHVKYDQSLNQHINYSEYQLASHFDLIMCIILLFAFFFSHCRL
jgi:hypothetical protein